MLMSQDIGWRLVHSYAQLPDLLYSSQLPTPVRAPELVIFNDSLANSLGLNFSHQSNDAIAAIFSGNHLPKEADPIAMAYAGHQFGHINILGDGRALLLGEQITPDETRVDIQLKGSGVTPFSRNGDGRAALGPMLREFAISEAMHHLNIPTTRSLCVVSTGEAVMREKDLAGAIMTRVADSHIRIGTFEFLAIHRRTDILTELVHYSIERHYPELKGSESPALELVTEIAHRQIELIVNWMRVGFVHGVMNTDNVSIAGETIDYGPCAFMDAYHPGTVFSSIDHGGRYAYGNQPAIIQWNLARLCESLLPLIDSNHDIAVEKAETLIQSLTDYYLEKWQDMMGTKIGLSEVTPDDVDLIHQLLTIMQNYELDYTASFKTLGMDAPETAEIFQIQDMQDWLTAWKNRLNEEGRHWQDILAQMHSVNPVVIPRNHKVEQALSEAEDGDLKEFNLLMDMVQNPYDYENDRSAWEEMSHAPKFFRTFCGT